jgi:hypothetical protein
MTEVLKANTEAELLALIPRIAGFTVTNSIICLAFGGSRTLGAFRVDVPSRKRLADYRAVSSLITGSLGRMPGADGVALAVYTDLTFEAEHGMPLVAFERHLSERIDREGFIIKRGFCVSPDGWASYFDRDYPREGRPLAEIAAAEALPEFSRWSELPPVTRAQQNAYAEQVADNCSGNVPDDILDLIETSPLDLVEQLVTWEGRLPLALGVELIQLAQSPARREVISLQVAFGRLVGEAVEEKGRAYARLHAEQGGTMDDVVRTEVAAGRASLDDEFTGLLMGKGKVRPDPARIERMIEHLRHLIALAPAHERLNPLCILAYLLWARGLSSVAGHYVGLALAIDGQHGMALLLKTMLTHGMVPEWAYPQ